MAMAMTALTAGAMTWTYRHGLHAWPWVLDGVVGALLGAGVLISGGHFYSDVALGAATALAIGAAIPMAHRRAERTRIAVAPGRAPKHVGRPAMYRDSGLSPDGKHILRATIDDLCEAAAHGESEQIDHLVGVVPEKMCAQDPLALLFDQDLEVCIAFADPSRRIPFGCALIVGTETQLLCSCLGLRQADGRKRGNGENN